jgi:hypothetical protein
LGSERFSSTGADSISSSLIVSNIWTISSGSALNTVPAGDYSFREASALSDFFLVYTERRDRSYGGGILERFITAKLTKLLAF